MATGHAGRLDEQLPAARRVYVANHSSPLDIAAMLVACPDATFVAGVDLYRVPLLAGAMRAFGTVPVDRQSHERVRLCVPADQVTDELSLVVFPEGSIAPVGRRMPFKRSAFAVAIELEAEVVPVAIHHTSRVLPPSARLGVRPGTVAVEVLAPISTGGLTLDDRGALAAAAERCILNALDTEDGGIEPYHRRWAISGR
ncbi:MAG: lysophospholipid acyltransferase family protein [Acidimicrobiales bacterium]